MPSLSVARSLSPQLARHDPDNVEHPIPTYDLSRTLRFATFGAVMGESFPLPEESPFHACEIGPVIGRWASFLETRFPLRTTHNANASFTALIKRVFSDQVVM